METMLIKDREAEKMIRPLHSEKRLTSTLKKDAIIATLEETNNYIGKEVAAVSTAAV